MSSTTGIRCARISGGAISGDISSTRSKTSLVVSGLGIEHLEINPTTVSYTKQEMHEIGGLLIVRLVSSANNNTSRFILVVSIWFPTPRRGASPNLLDGIQMVKVHLSPQWSLQGISTDFSPGLGTSIGPGPQDFHLLSL